MYAYTPDETFKDFDARVVSLLRRGLLRGMGQAARRPRWLARTAVTAATAGVAAKTADGVRLLARRAARISKLRSLPAVQRLLALQPPLPRRSSRTDLLEATLRDEIFGRRTLTSSRRGDIDVVLNACELRSGSAFRFGSRESGCWRYGRVAKNDTIEVAHAVAASAAYPVLLPALDRTMAFVDRKGAEIQRRVLLTDGGIFDNLGTSCLEPGRDEAISTNTFSPEYIIACDAGPGLFSDDVVPYWWATRMVRSFDSVFRKAGNAAYARLHRLGAAGAIQGFVHAYLGQRDDGLPYRPANFVPRDVVMNYPTDFAPMVEQDILHISDRGEQLTRILIEYYCPEL
jgi:NTE family protein